MSLRDYEFKISYRSGRDDLICDFYLPALANSIEYNRAVGFFSTSMLNNLGKNIYPFIKNGGIIKLVCGVELSEQDVEEINQGYSLRNEIITKIIENVIVRNIEDLSNDYLTSNLSNICWMIAKEKLNIKIAIRTRNGKISSGIYHEKTSIFKDNKGNYIATNGSSNETSYGYIYNFEYFDVFKSWEGQEDRIRIEEKLKYFADLWLDNTKELLILEFPSAARDNFIKKAPKEPVEIQTNKLYSTYINNENNIIKIEPKGYQNDAIENWFLNHCRGILEMATGTGKTYTSLFAIKRYIQDKQGLLIVCCPYIHLVDQWEKSVREIFPDEQIVKCYENYNIWAPQLIKLIQNYILGIETFGIIITTTNTGSDDKFINIINNKVPKIVICDEVHNIGAEHNKNFLNIDSHACIGLSATPIRRFDEEGNRAIVNYFGTPVYQLGLKEAIDMGFLVKYNYFITYCQLNEIEYEDYKSLTKKISKLCSSSYSLEDDCIQNLLIKRARIISKCKNKLESLNSILNNISNYENMLVYTAEDPNFFNQVLSVLQHRDIITLKITADIVDNNVRRDIIKKLTNKDINCILAMRCLDEGVDIPSADKAIILASSTNTKQYIQRRGRVLRKSDETGKRFADIYDVLVIPPEFVNELDKNLFERELLRILEFACLARNRLQILTEIINFSKTNSLLKNFTKLFKEFEL